MNIIELMQDFSKKSFALENKANLWYNKRHIHEYTYGFSVPPAALKISGGCRRVKGKQV